MSQIVKSDNCVVVIICFMNMFKKVKAKTIEEYWDGLPEERREMLVKLHNLVIKAAPELQPNFLYNMPGYGSFEYKNYKGEIINWPTIAIASQKNYVSVYVCSLEKGKYLAEIYKERLGKVSVGKSCIRFAKLGDVKMAVLEEVIRLASKKPGLVGG